MTGIKLEHTTFLVYGNDTVGVYETTLPTNNSFERGDILGVYNPINASHQVLYQVEGGYCDTLGEITIHLFGSWVQYLPLEPVLPYITIETGQWMSFKLIHLSIFINVMNVFIHASSQHCAMGFLKKESLQVIVDALRDSS